MAELAEPLRVGWRTPWQHRVPRLVHTDEQANAHRFGWGFGTPQGGSLTRDEADGIWAPHRARWGIQPTQ